MKTIKTGADYMYEEIMEIFEVDEMRARKLLDCALLDHEVTCEVLNYISDYNANRLYKRYNIEPDAY